MPVSVFQKILIDLNPIRMEVNFEAMVEVSSLHTFS